MDDKDRLRQFDSQNSKLDEVDELLDDARYKLKLAMEKDTNPQLRNDIKGIYHQLGQLREDLRKSKNMNTRAKAGAKLQAKTRDQDGYENRE